MSAAQGPRTGRSGALRRPPRGSLGGVAVLALSAALIAGITTSDANTGAAAPAAKPAPKWTWSLPKGFPVPRVPAKNPMSTAKADLGRYLFYDIRLSGNGTTSCGSCHLQSLAFTDGKAVSTGSTGETTPRGSMPLQNVAYNATLTWANPSLVTLERQMETPLFGERPVEMGVNDHNKLKVLARIRKDRRYQAKFRTAFPRQASPITWANIVKSIATFQRSLISADSKYDRYQRGKATLTVSETRGKDLFFGERAECHHCHGGINFNDQVSYVGKRPEPLLFHNTGLYNIGGTGAFPEGNRGVFELTARAKDMGAFRAQSLRNVAVTAPYMHDGSLATLEEVVQFYADGGRNVTSGPFAGDGRLSPFRSDLTVGIDLTDQEKADLVAFLKTLTDRRFLTERRFSDPFATGR
ncbi:MAG: di-heme enzyme [Thermoleophilia bacterium]